MSQRWPLAPRLPISSLVSSKFSWHQIQIFTLPVIFKIAQTGRYLAILSLPALHIPRNFTQHMSAIDKIGRCGYKVPSCCCPLESSDPEMPHHASEGLCLQREPSVREFACLPHSGCSPLPFILWAVCAVSNFPSHAALSKHHTIKWAAHYLPSWPYLFFLEQP